MEMKSESANDEKRTMEECLNTIFSSYSRDSKELIPILQKVQDEFGYLSENNMMNIARFTGIPESRVYAVASFYAQFRFTPMGKKRVMACRGTACHIQGAPQILDEIERKLCIKEGETTEDLEYTLETVACIGCCALAPCVMINGDVAAKLTPKKAAELFNKGEPE